MKGAHSHVADSTSHVIQTSLQLNPYFKSIDVTVHFFSTYIVVTPSLPLTGETNLFKICLVLAFSFCIWRDRGADVLLRVPLPLWSPPPHSAHISTHLDIPVYLSMGGPSGTKTNPLTPMQADPGYTRLSDFRNQQNLTACFAVFVWRMKEVKDAGGWRNNSGGGESPIVRLEDHLTCGFYSWPHNARVGGGEGVLPVHRQCFPVFPDPTGTIQWANIKRGFMKLELIWALKVCETCLGTKGRLWAREQAEGISFSSHRLPCVFLIDRPPAAFDRNDMQLAGSLPVGPPSSRKIVLDVVQKKLTEAPPPACVINGQRRGVFRSLQMTPAWEKRSVWGRFL